MKSQKEIKQNVNSFLGKYLLYSEPSFANLCAAAKKLGFDIIYYSPNHIDDDLQIIVDNLQIEFFVKNERAFTYVSSEYRLVFIHEALSEEEKQLVLAHELGHIVCEHFGHLNIIGVNQCEEHEANEFAHYLLYPSPIGRVLLYVGRHKKLAIAITIILIVFLLTAISVTVKYHRSLYCNDLYVTESGTKYHKEECSVIKGKNNTRRLTVKEYEEGIYSPCSICVGND